MANYPGGFSLVRFNDRYKNVDSGMLSRSFIDIIRSASSSTRAHIQPGGTDRCHSVPSNALRSVSSFSSQSVLRAGLDVQ